MSTWPQWERGEYLSASAIKTFKSCERNFYFEYHTDVEGAEKDTQYADLGTAVHEAIELALAEGRAGFKNRALNLYHEFADDFDLPQDRIGEGRECIATAAKYINSRDDIEIQEIEAEIPFVIDELSQPMAAKLDIVADGEIWDWKTGTNRDKEWVQAAVYTGAYAAEYGEQPEKVNFVYLKKGEVFTHQPRMDEYKKLKRTIKEINRAKDTGQFPARPGSACYWCPYEFNCSESDVGYGNVNWEAY